MPLISHTLGTRLPASRLVTQVVRLRLVGRLHPVVPGLYLEMSFQMVGLVSLPVSTSRLVVWLVETISRLRHCFPLGL